MIREGERLEEVAAEATGVELDHRLDSERAEDLASRAALSLAPGPSGMSSRPLLLLQARLGEEENMRVMLPVS